MAKGEMLRLRLKGTKVTERKHIKYLLAHTAKNHMQVKLLSTECTIKQFLKGVFCSFSFLIVF